MFGSMAGFTAAAIMQPLENVKMVLMIPPNNLTLTNNFLKNLLISTKFLYKDGGLKTFYRGVTPNVLKTAFSSSIYFSVLRLCEKLHQQSTLVTSSMYTSFVSSMIGRIASAVMANPLSIVETRFQYAGSERWKGGVLSSLKKLYVNEGVGGYFKGGLASCYKQGLFAGLYYMFYQEGKALGLMPIIAGMLSGIISTSLTHPFEIIRAELQSFALTEHTVTKLSIFKQIQILFKSG